MMKVETVPCAHLQLPPISVNFQISCVILYPVANAVST